MLEIKKRKLLRGKCQQGRLRERLEQPELGYIYQGDNHNNMLGVWQGCSKEHLKHCKSRQENYQLISCRNTSFTVMLRKEDGIMEKLC